MAEDYSNLFSPMEIDAIGEILNISLGSSATAISNMVERRVNITTPSVEIVSLENFEFKHLEPAVGVEITYTKGLDGNNIMLLKRRDVKIIVELLMNTEIPDDEFELDEMNMSAVAEVMNQMMGASSTALAEFLGERVDISTPITFEITDDEEFKNKYFSSTEPMIVVRFDLAIEDSLQSEFMCVMLPSLAKRLVAGFGLSDTAVPEIEPAAPAPAAEESIMSEDAIAALLAQDTTPAAADDVSAVLSEDAIAAMLAESAAAAPAPAPVSSLKRGSTFRAALSSRRFMGESLKAAAKGRLVQSLPDSGGRPARKLPSI